MTMAWGDLLEMTLKSEQDRILFVLYVFAIMRDDQQTNGKNISRS